MSRNARIQMFSTVFVILLACSAAAAVETTTAAAVSSNQSSASVQTDRIECKNVQCSPVRCPDDSEPFVEQQPDETKNFNYKDDYDANNIDDTLVDDNDENNDEIKGEQQNRRHVTNFNKFYVEPSNDRDQENRTLVKRSLQYKRRAPIKIIPGSLVPELERYHNFGSVIHHKWKRDASSALPAVEIKDEVIDTDECCPKPECICKDNCEIPTCPKPGFVVIETKRGNMDKPGECCPIYQCTSEPNCTDIVANKEATWIEACKTCQCRAGHRICHNTCGEEEELPKNCLSSNLNRLFFDGDTWKEDECTQCECQDSIKKCQTSFCRPLNCAQKIKIAGECCPVCVEATTAGILKPATSDETSESAPVSSSAPPASTSILVASTTASTSTATASSSTTPDSVGNELPIPRIYDPHSKYDIERIVLYISIVGLSLICVVFAYLWYREKNKKQNYGPVPSFDSNLNRVPSPITTS